jgi:hypothetical protein
MVVFCGIAGTGKVFRWRFLSGVFRVKVSDLVPELSETIDRLEF